MRGRERATAVHEARQLALLRFTNSTGSAADTERLRPIQTEQMQPQQSEVSASVTTNYVVPESCL